MRGSIIRPAGDRRTWSFVIDVGRDPQTGKRRQRWKGGFKTRRAAQEALTRTLNDRREGTYVEPSKQTLGEYLEEWLEAKEGAVSTGNLRRSTFDSYRMNVRAHIIPRLGSIQLAHLTPADLDAFYGDLLKGGRREGGGELSKRTVRYVHMIVRKALEDAIRWGRLVRNPADRADPPKPKRVEQQAWSRDQLRTFLAHVANDRLYPAYVLAATTGMRRGEILGLRWEDVNLEEGRLRVRQTLIEVDGGAVFSEPKTDRSKRSLSLDPGTVAVMRGHKRRQLEERLAWGEGYQESGLVFTREDGAPLRPAAISEHFERQVRATALPLIRFHDLRHTYATLALQARVPVKIVSDRLGHSTVAITYDTYTHVLPDDAEQEASRVGSMILDGEA